MGKRARPGWAVQRPAEGPHDDRKELALLAEFRAHDSVSALAEAIAKRLGGGTRAGDLMAAADVGAGRQRN